MCTPITHAPSTSDNPMGKMMRCAVLALAIVAAAQSVMGASYVGCFPAASFGAATPTASVAACEKTCAADKKPLVAIVSDSYPHQLRRSRHRSFCLWILLGSP